MKAKSITMQIVKNLGNYETVRLEVEFELLPDDDIQSSFVTAKKELEQSFFLAYPKKGKEAEKERKELLTTSSEFNRVCQALHDGKTDIKDLQNYFIIHPDAFNYFQANNLI